MIIFRCDSDFAVTFFKSLSLETRTEIFTDHKLQCLDFLLNNPAWVGSEEYG